MSGDRGTADELEAARRAVVDEHGPWTAYNLDLGQGITTFGRSEFGAPETNIRRVAQLVADSVGRPLSAIRVLDLGAYEGGFAIELASAGAEVVALEGREHHVAKIRFVQETLGLERLSVKLADVRDLPRLGLGRFDVVLCLGLLYHLDAPDCFRLVEQIRSCCDDLTIIETQVSVTPEVGIMHNDREYWGRYIAEDTSLPGAATENQRSFWLTKPSLLNLLAETGFTSVTEAHVPAVPQIARFRDHVMLVAKLGNPWVSRALPSPDTASEWRYPERLEAVTAPQQARRWLTPRRRSAQATAIAGIFRPPGQ